MGRFEQCIALQMHSMVHISSTRNSSERCQFGGCQREHTICCAQSTMSGRNMQGKIILHISTKVWCGEPPECAGFRKDHICIRCGFKMARKSARDCRQRKSIFRFFGPSTKEPARDRGRASAGREYPAASGRPTVY